jgi:hypothetical protein
MTTLHYQDDHDAMINLWASRRLPRLREMHARFSAGEWSPAAQVPTQYAADDGGQWITIGGHEERDKKHVGGTPVYIVGGRIVKGHGSLVGKRIDALREDAPELTHRQALKAERERARKQWGKEARQAGVRPEHLHQLAAEIMAHDRAAVEERTAMLREARQALSEFGGKHKALTTGRIEQSNVRGMDEVAEDLAQRYPHAFDERHGHVSDQLHDMLTRGNPQPMSEDAAYDQALSHLTERAAREREELEAVPFGAQALPTQYQHLAADAAFSAKMDRYFALRFPKLASMLRDFAAGTWPPRPSGEQAKQGPRT